jgi:hypothetical protein
MIGDGPMTMSGSRLAAAGAVVLLLITGALAQTPDGAGLTALLDRVGARVEEYYARAQSIVCLETVRVQPLKMDLLSDGFPRRLDYELRIAWEPAESPDALPEANIVRQLLRVGGRPPKNGDEPKCMDPRSISPEPLEMLLAGHRAEYVFTPGGTGRTGGRDAVIIEYRSAERGAAEVTWNDDDCASISLPGRSAGRVWVDRQTGDVLRLDEHLLGQFDFRVPREHDHGGPRFLTIERSDSTTRYEPVAFTDPDETLMLPKSIEVVQVVRGAGVPRVRITQSFTDYRRFLTDAHLVPNPVQ